jgi:hypothetical protein
MHDKSMIVDSKSVKDTFSSGPLNLTFQKAMLKKVLSSEHNALLYNYKLEHLPVVTKFL